MANSADLTFLTNEPGRTMRERFAALLRTDTRQFDCLVGYFFISGFYKLYPSLENVAKIRILVGLQTDRPAYDLIQQANQAQEAAKGAAQKATELQDATLNELDDWIAQYLKIAKVALREDSQLLEKIGVLSRTTKTAAQRAAPAKASATRAAKVKS